MNHGPRPGTLGFFWRYKAPQTGGSLQKASLESGNTDSQVTGAQMIYVTCCHSLCKFLRCLQQSRLVTSFSPTGGGDSSHVRGSARRGAGPGTSLRSGSVLVEFTELGRRRCRLCNPAGFEDLMLYRIHHNNLIVLSLGPRPKALHPKGTSGGALCHLNTFPFRCTVSFGILFLTVRNSCF